MEELRDTRSIVEIGENEGDALPRALDGLSEQIRILIKHRIFHVDLHPGNVLVGKADKIYIVDFDKACYFKGTQHALRELYLRRWRRAVIKHKLSPLLSEMMSLTLRSYDE
jgi:3-deoxy-D-manno-octulosonic acid kinase